MPRKPSKPEPLTNAQRTIVADNIGLVYARAWIVRRARSAKIDDLVSEGSLALCNAAKHFDSSRGIRFSTYATRAIDRAMRSIGRAMRCGKRNPAREAFSLDAGDVSTPDSAISVDERSTVKEAFRFLGDRERRVIYARFFGGQTLAQIGVDLNISKERSRQIESQAMSRLQRIYSR